jgi:hypothetical protein
MRAQWIALCVLPFLWGCDSLKADTSTLWSTSSAPAYRPRCDACHGFAPRTGGHRYHLDSLRSSGVRHTTCMDCHAASIAFSNAVIDTTFFDPNPEKLSNHSADYPWHTFLRPDTIDPSMIEVNSLDSVPMSWAEREAGAENPFWITADAKGPGLPGHANGKVDVVFAERNANFIDFSTDTNGVVHKASWNPIRLSCNAVACHNSDAMDSAKYVWKDVVKVATP